MKYFFAFFFITCQLAAQEKINWDTTRYQKFRSNLIIGIFQSYHNLNNEFNSLDTSDKTGRSHNHYKAESKLFTGIAVTYDKFSLGLSLKSEPQDNNFGKGASNTFIATFNAGGNVWFIENSYRYFKGFYDSNSPAYDPEYKNTGAYRLQPNMINILGRSKFMYFTNHRRYSFRANTSCNYRQRRSAATWVLSANANYNLIHNDSSFFAVESRPYYGKEASMNGFRSLGISVNAGAAFTLVIWRALFLSVMVMGGPEQQFREYSYPDQTVRLSYLRLSGDFRIASGLNFKRCYLTSFTSTEAIQYNSSFMKLTHRTISHGLIFGWRLNSHIPSFYKKIQKTKLYLAL